MLRSLYSGITGLSANSIALDVIGNNIANANTVGYKSSRVTFREMLTQTVRPSQRPVSGSRGGVNAQQVGLGSSVASIDSRFTQGHLETTGLVNDLALQGDGFFVLSDGAGRYYTRSGAFGLDANNYFVDPSTGLHLQGLMADDNGVVQAGAYEDLYLDPGRTVPALSSTSVRLYGNLNSDAEAQGTIMESTHFMAAATGTDLLTALYGQGGGAMNLIDDDQISLTGLVTGASGSNTLNLPAFEVGTDGTTLADLAAWVQTSLESLPDLAPGEVTVSIAADGAISLSNTSTGTVLQNLQLTIPGRLDFNQSFRFSPSIGAGETGTTYDATRSAGQIRAAATTDDLLTGVYNSRGQSLGLNVSATNPSTTIMIGGSVGEHQAPSNTMSVDAATTFGDLMTGLQIALGISTTPVSLDDEGRIVMSGEVGIDNALGQVDIREVGEINPTLETSFGFVETQEADDGSEFTASATVYDSLGDVHNVLFTFSKVIGRNEWNWVAEMEGDEVMVSGNTGTASFAETGEIIAFRYTDDAGGLSFRPQADGTTGALPITLQIDAGQFGGLSGLTQYAANETLQTIADGHTVGSLLDYEINADGIIIGRFSNDTVQTLGQIGLARFSNMQGLLRTEGNTYQVSGNSGLAVEGFAGGESDTFITSGALEGSNVDLTQELTNMVIAQRAFQANAKVITTGDQILQDIVSMVR
ncbi:MAG: hypothetical protein C0395_05195 [Gemmatimonas sp.]|nr:hypothetical protein [Gemmatimonas sp.]